MRNFIAEPEGSGEFDDVGRMKVDWGLRIGSKTRSRQWPGEVTHYAGGLNMRDKQLESLHSWACNYIAEREWATVEHSKLSFPEKLQVLARIQRRAYAAGLTKVKPWPIDDSPRD